MEKAKKTGKMLVDWKKGCSFAAFKFYGKDGVPSVSVAYGLFSCLFRAAKPHGTSPEDSSGAQTP